MKAGVPGREDAPAQDTGHWTLDTGQRSTGVAGARAPTPRYGDLATAGRGEIPSREIDLACASSLTLAARGQACGLRSAARSTPSDVRRGARGRACQSDGVL